MGSAYNIPFFIILFLMILSVISLLIRDDKSIRKLTLFSYTLIALMAAILVVVTWNNDGYTFTYSLGHFPAPWGNELKSSSLEAILALTFSLVMLLSVVGGTREFEKDIEKEKRYLFYLMMNLTLMSLMALIFTNDLFTAYVFIEINTVAACAIVVVKEKGETLKAAVKYLIMSIMASGLFLLAISILYSLTGHLLINNIHESVVKLMASGQFRFPLQITVGLFIIAIGIKSALFPFHTWLPDAHSSATSSASAVLSGLVLKGYIVILIKLIYSVYGVETFKSLDVFPVILAFGLLAMIYGSINAYYQTDLKRMIAYSSIAQIGYIYMGLGLNNRMGYIAACFHIVVHAFTKSMLFITAGELIRTAQSYQIKDIKGVFYKNKLATIAFLVGTLSMVGTPLFGGFGTKVYLILSSLESRPMGVMITCMLVLSISTLLNAMYYLPIVVNLFLKNDKNNEVSEINSESITKIALLIFIAINITLGIFFQSFSKML